MTPKGVEVDGKPTGKDRLVQAKTLQIPTQDEREVLPEVFENRSQVLTPDRSNDPDPLKE